MKDIENYISYNAETGELKWIASPAYNRNKLSVTGNKTKSRYAKVQFRGKTYLAHRVAWYIANGKEPSGQIDHINGNKFDNRLCNLRDVSAMENMNNLTMHREHGKLFGAHYLKRLNKWQASACLNGKAIYVGVFATAIEAHLATKNYIESLGGQ